MKSPKRLVLLDAHAILHRAYHALPDFSTAKGEPTGALYGLSAMLIKIIEDLKPDYLVACYDLKGPTYRHEIYKGYKAQRKAAEDDLIAQMNRSRDIFQALNIPIYDKQGFEADDMLGTIVEQVARLRPSTSSGLRRGEVGQEVRDKKLEIRDEKLEVERGDISPISNLSSPISSLEIIIASGDMDTLQLVKGETVKVYTLKKGLNDTIMYDEEAVQKRFGFGPELIPDYKGLRGDPSDNIIGVAGIGEKTATILITTFGSIENIYKELESPESDQKFKKAGLSPRIIQLLRDNKEEAEFSKMLATIRRDAPIDFVLPEKTFRENLDVQKVTKLWQELEFRTLTARLEKAVREREMGDGRGEIRDEELENRESQNHASENNEDVGGELGLKFPLVKGVPRPNEGVGYDDNVAPEDLKKTALALWLVDSGRTNPTIEDIKEFEGLNDYKKAKEAIYVQLDKRNVRKVYEEIELPLIPVLERMEKRGVKIDRSVMNGLAKDYHAEVDRLEKKIWELAGTEFNINSPKQLGEILFDKLGLTAKNMKKTSGGARSTRESELEKLKDLHPTVPLIFEYRELQKLLSTYIDAIPPLLDADDRLHTSFISSGTTTGRMASQNPNLQNIPIKSEAGRAIRKAFIAEKNFVLCGFDYSQMELRIAAFLSGDEKLIEIFRKGEDIHASVASFVFKVPLTEVTPDMRRQAKVINFGIIYGMGVTALQQNLGTNRTAAQEFLNSYFETFSTLADYLDKVKKETAERGYTETFFGRRRYFEGIHSKIPYIKAAAERMAINAPIQGTEADIIKLAMIRIEKYITERNLTDQVFPLLQVHDELIYEIASDKAAEIAPEIERIMESVLDPVETKGVILKASAAIGNNWGELK